MLTLAYGSEKWAIRRTDESRLISTDTCFMRTEGYTLSDHKQRNRRNYKFHK
jgi:hypothetical protein